MSLREEMWRYEQITGESAEHVPIIKLGAFLDGYDRGIEASEQGLILDKIRAKIKNHCGLAKEDRCKYCYRCNNVLGVKEILDIIDKCKAESKEQPKTGDWIPCSERLPEKNGNYLVTVEANDGTASLKFQMVDHYGPDWLHEEKHEKVIAWMPLPEPYNAESEVNADGDSD